MDYGRVDYSSCRVYELLCFFEQFVQSKPTDNFGPELNSILAIVRAIHAIGKGTCWLSELSGT